MPPTSSATKSFGIFSSQEKHWVNPNCQNSEPTKRTVSIWAIDKYYNYTELQTDHFTMGQILAEIMIICFLSTYVNEN